jgi:hypothetical protein
VVAGVVAVVVGVIVPGFVVVPVGVVLVVVVCVGASEAGAVEVPDAGEEPVDGSAASAAPPSGPPSPTAVKPPPASAEMIARRVHERAPFTPDMLDPCSSLCGPVVAVEQGAARGRRPLDHIHIGREPHLGKGFVIRAVTGV